ARIPNPNGVVARTGSHGPAIPAGPGRTNGFRRLATQLGYVRFLGLDQRVELRNLLGIPALLVFAEEEEIRAVLGPPAIEKQLVFFEDDPAQVLAIIETCLSGFHPSQRSRHSLRDALVAVAVQVDAIVGALRSELRRK